jgi:hypothetical protein
MPKFFLKISIVCLLILKSSSCFASQDNSRDFHNDEAANVGSFVRSRVIAFEDNKSERLIKGGAMLLGGILGYIGGDYIGNQIMSLRTLLEDTPNASHQPCTTVDMYDEGANSRFGYFAFGAMAAGLCSPKFALLLVGLGVGDYLLNTNFLKSVAKWVLHPSIAGPRYVSTTVGGTVGAYTGLKIGQKIVDIKRNLLHETAAERVIANQGTRAEVLMLEAGEHIKKLNRGLDHEANQDEMTRCLEKEMGISTENAKQILANIYLE